MLNKLYKELWEFIDPALYAIGATLTFSLGLAIF